MDHYFARRYIRSCIFKR